MSNEQRKCDLCGALFFYSEECWCVDHMIERSYTICWNCQHDPNRLDKIRAKRNEQNGTSM